MWKRRRFGWKTEFGIYFWKPVCRRRISPTKCIGKPSGTRKGIGKTKGLVIRETGFGEWDKYITVLSEDGICSVLCKGVRSKNSKNAPATRLFCYSEFTVHESRGKFTLKEAAVRTPFWGVTEDMARYALFCYFSQLAERAVFGDRDQAKPVLELFLRALYSVTEKQRSLTLVKSVFELRLAAGSGFLPDLAGCPHVGAEGPVCFSIADGTAVCPACAPAGYITISRGVFDALRFICSAETRRVFSFSLPPAGEAALGALAERYLLYHWGEKPKTLEFYKSLATTEFTKI